MGRLALASGCGQPARLHGRYANALYGEMRVVQDDTGLVADVGALAMRLEPAQPGLFGASTSALEPPEPLRCDRGRIGWRGQAFVRQ